MKPDFSEIKRFRYGEALLYSPDLGPSSVENLEHTLIVRLDCLAEVVRKDVGYKVPFVISSGYRSKAHNAKVGGTRGSQHVLGRAVDISTRHMSRTERKSILKWARACGFVGIGVAKTYIHLDIRKGAPPAAWTYNDRNKYVTISVGDELDYA